MKKITIAPIAAFALLTALSFNAIAHGDTAHAQHGGEVVKEQKEWGIAGDASQARRTITIDMKDTMRFTPDRITVKRGETVRLAVRNQGQILHEIVLGTGKSLDEHAAMMLKFPNMEHAEPYMAHVAPGQSEDLVWNFNRTGTFDFACLIPGHFQAGMRGTITVTP